MLSNIVQRKKANKLDTLVDKGIIEINEEGLPVRSEDYSRAGGHLYKYSDEEIASVVLPYVYQDFRTSSREIARITGISTKTINKCRRSPTFKKMLAEATNDRLLHLRCKALDTLENILRDPKVNNTAKIKACVAILQHSVAVTQVAVEIAKEKPKINVDDILKELEDMQD